MDAQSWVAISAVVVAGIVSVLSGLVAGIVAVLSGFTPVLIDWRKSKREESAVEREQLAAEIAKIERGTIELLSQLAHFNQTTSGGLEESYRGPARQAYSELRAKHYAWEHAIWSRLGSNEREEVTVLRRKFERVDRPDALFGQVSDLSDSILTVTYSATGRS